MYDLELHFLTMDHFATVSRTGPSGVSCIKRRAHDNAQSDHVVIIVN